jgi:inorganic pyrophosphatase
MAKTNYTSPIGIEVWKGDWAEAEWTITGYPKQDMTIKQFESAYDFEEYVQKKINCSNITFDSEMCQFFAYAKTKQRATSFAKAIDKHFAKIRELVN